MKSRRREQKRQKRLIWLAQERFLAIPHLCMRMRLCTSSPHPYPPIPRKCVDNWVVFRFNIGYTFCSSYDRHRKRDGTFYGFDESTHTQKDFSYECACTLSLLPLKRSIVWSTKICFSPLNLYRLVCRNVLSFCVLISRLRENPV